MITVPTKSREQEKMYHDLIGQIAKVAQHAGARWEAEDWTRFLIDQWAKDAGVVRGRLAPSLDGERVVQLGMQSRKFTIEQGTSFIEWLFWYGSENGIDFEQ